jgi:hypothetical protein
MGKKQWTTSDQRTWLEALIPAFLHAQRDKKTKSFLDGAYNKWHKKWPATVPTEDEVKATGGNIDRALACNQKAEEKVSVHSFHSDAISYCVVPAHHVLVP